MNTLQFLLRRRGSRLIAGLFVAGACSLAGRAWAEQKTAALPDLAAWALKPAKVGPWAFSSMILGAATAGPRIVAVGERGVVLLSDDGGATYRQARQVPVRLTLTAVSFADASHGWAVGHGGVVLATADGGETWSLLRSDLAVDQPLFGVYFRNPLEGWAVGLWSLLLSTRDGGRTWETHSLAPPAGATRADRNLYGIFPGTKGELFVAAEQGTVLRSVDNGRVWSYVDTGLKGSLWAGLAAADGSVTLGGLRGAIVKSPDGGQAWMRLDSGSRSSITGMAATATGLWAVGLDGVLVRSTDRGATFQRTQRQDRLPYTAVVAAPNGSPVTFSKAGPSKIEPAAAARPGS